MKYRITLRSDKPDIALDFGQGNDIFSESAKRGDWLVGIDGSGVLMSEVMAFVPSPLVQSYASGIAVAPDPDGSGEVIGLVDEEGDLWVAICDSSGFVLQEDLPDFSAGRSFDYIKENWGVKQVIVK